MLLSLPKIRSGRIGGATRTRLEWRQWTPDRWTARFRGRRGFSTGTSSSIGALPLSLPRLLERLFMQIPLQISFENAEPSEAVRAAIGHEVERLEKYQHPITGCRVAVVAPSTKHRHGAVYRINIWVTIPPHENIVVSHQPSDDRAHVHVE